MPDYGDDKGFQGSGSGEASTGVGDRDAADRSRDQYNRNKQITETNPYGEDGFFSRVLGIDPSKISYAGNFSTNPSQDLAIRQGIANNQFDKFTNPMRDLGQRPGTVRPGLSAGDMTAFGPVQSQYKQQTPQEMAARFGAGVLGGPLFGGILSQLGTKENVIAGLSPGFDPNNPRGPQGMLGKIASTLSGGLDPTQATARAAAGIQSLRDRFAPSTPTPGVMPVSPPDRPARNPRTGFEEQKSDRYVGSQQLIDDVFSKGVGPYLDQTTATSQNPVPQISGFADVNRRRVGVLDDLGMAARQLGENIVAIPGGYMNTETGRTYSGQYNPNARARTFTGTQQPQGTAPFSFGSFIQNIVGQ
jgi:hypothetical protein